MANGGEEAERQKEILLKTLYNNDAAQLETHLQLNQDEEAREKRLAVLQQQWIREAKAQGARTARSLMRRQRSRRFNQCDYWRWHYWRQMALMVAWLNSHPLPWQNCFDIFPDDPVSYPPPGLCG